MDTNQDLTSSSWKLDGAAVVGGVLWLMAALIVGSVMVRKVRLYIYFYRRRKYMEEYLKLCNQQYNQRCLTQQTHPAPHTAPHDLHAIDEEAPGLQGTKSGQDCLQGPYTTCSTTNELCEKNKSSIFIGIGNDTTDLNANDLAPMVHGLESGRKVTTNEVREVDRQQDKQQEKQRCSGVKCLPAILEEPDSKSQHLQQNNGQWQREITDMMLLEDSDLMGGSFFSYMPMPRIIVEDADL